MPVIQNLPDLGDPDLTEDLKPPPRLYHYTDAKGFFGVVEAKVALWATHFRFLNDSGEVAFGDAVVTRGLELIHHEIGAIGVDVADLIEPTKELAKEDRYFACLSKRNDVLSQWRAYANGGDGYCVAVHPDERFIYSGDEDDYSSNHLVKCLYGEVETRDWLVRGFRRKIEIACRRSDPDGKSDWLVSELMRVARRCLHRAKHEHFREECEWRIVVEAPQNATKFRTGPLGLTPYLATEPMILEEVWTGPRVGPDAEVAKHTIEQFLARHKLSATIQHWASPFGR